MTARLLVSGARVLTPGGEWPRGWIAVEGRRIAAMGQGDPPPGVGAGADLLAADGLVAMPGFIDLHVHGDPAPRPLAARGEHPGSADQQPRRHGRLRTRPR